MVEFVVRAQRDQTAITKTQSEENLHSRVSPNSWISQLLKLRIYVKVNADVRTIQHPASDSKNEQDQVGEQSCKVNDFAR